MHVIPYSKRAMLLRLKTFYGNLNIVEIYAPTGEKGDEEVECPFEVINDILKQAKPKYATLPMGVVSVKLDQDREENCVGNHKLGTRIDIGDRLIQFFKRKSLYKDIT